MNRIFKTIFFLFLLAIVLGLLSHVPASAQWKTQEVPSSSRDTDLTVPPFKGPATAPVVIVVFSDFE